MARLRNRCGYSGNWVGFFLDDPGALVTVHGARVGESPTTRTTDSQAGSSLASESASEQLQFGLGEDELIMEVEIRCTDGREHRIPAGEIELNVYTDLRDRSAPDARTSNCG